MFSQNILKSFHSYKIYLFGKQEIISDYEVFMRSYETPSFPPIYFEHKFSAAIFFLIFTLFFIIFNFGTHVALVFVVFRRNFVFLFSKIFYLSTKSGFTMKILRNSILILVIIEYFRVLGFNVIELLKARKCIDLLSVPRNDR